MIISPSKSINKAYKQVTIERNSFNNFCYCLGKLFDDINDSQTEETQKTHLQAFFAKTFYGNYYMAPEGDIDLAIHLDKTENSHIGLILEVKNTTNKNEMISCNDLNKKALQELLLYYLRQRHTRNNTDLKYLVATNIFEYFIFDAQIFEKLFFNNSKLKKEFIDFENGVKSGTKTDFFYKEIASKYIAEVAKDLDYTYFNLLDYRNLLNRNSEPRADYPSYKKLVELYRVFSSTHLLKLPFQNDSNSLNKNFYSELLYILGLEEEKIENKYVIVRKGEGKRNDSSLIENAINILDSEDRLGSLNHINIYGETKNEQLFNVAMELCITWINRILFLKLLEAQLLKYHNGEGKYKFLTIKKIGDFDELNKLFFQVLARNYNDRKQDVIEKYKYIPYLNSSLFEMNELEHKTISINSLSQANLPLMATSVLKNRKNENAPESLPILQYIFEFLDAYNFSSEGSDEVQDEAKTLINASVLGLIFEKINGQKDGSVFTPGFITMFMSKESIERVVLQKFNENYGWKCEKLADIYNNIENVEDANKIINNLKICDPAVGSGHYLVSVLNELIKIKYELGILIDDGGKRIKKQNYVFSIENDELIVTDEEGELFKYIPGNPESQRIQELLFREKRQIIENCLFGVDINQNAVNICRLRLWIELLKNAYYTKESNYTVLETLPNIDINIKCGNSLLHRFDLKDNIQSILNEANISIKEYKEAVEKYKVTSVKDDKKEFLEIIGKIKSALRTELDKRGKTYVTLQKKRKEFSALDDPEFEGEGFKLSKPQLAKMNKLKKDIGELEEEIKEIRSNKIYLGAFEWRFEFPEVLDDDGNFTGFDCVIGNPPYMRIQEIRKEDTTFADFLTKNYDAATGSYDIYAAFVECAFKLVKSNGLINYIMPAKWTNSDFGTGLRKISNNRASKIISFGSYQIFDASTYTALQWFDNVSDELLYTKLKNTNISREELQTWLYSLNCDDFTKIKHCTLTAEKWYLVDNTVHRILEKLNSQPKRLSDVFEKIYQGLATSKDDIYFLYDVKTLNDNHIEGFSYYLNKKIKIERGLTKPLLKGEDVHRYRPLKSDKVVIFPYKIDGSCAELYQESELESMFPAGYQYLKSCESGLRAREKGRFDVDGKWYQFGRKQGINDSSKQKIVGPEISLRGNYSLDINGDYYHTTTVYGYIKNKKCNYHYETLLAILNSSILRWYIVNTGTTLANGFYRYKPGYLNKFPFPRLSKENESAILDIVSKIFVEFGNDVYTLDEQLDNMIFNFYDLTEQEQKIIKI